MVDSLLSPTNMQLSSSSSSSWWWLTIQYASFLAAIAVLVIWWWAPTRMRIWCTRRGGRGGRAIHTKRHDDHYKTVDNNESSLPAAAKIYEEETTGGWDSDDDSDGDVFKQALGDIESGRSSLDEVETDDKPVDETKLRENAKDAIRREGGSTASKKNSNDNYKVEDDRVKHRKISPQEKLDMIKEKKIEFQQRVDEARRRSRRRAQRRNNAGGVDHIFISTSTEGTDPAMPELLSASLCFGGGYEMVNCEFYKCRNRALRDKMKRCARCNKITYCSKDCQGSDWKRHQRECYHGGY